MIPKKIELIRSIHHYL